MRRIIINLALIIASICAYAMTPNRYTYEWTFDEKDIRYDTECDRIWGATYYGYGIEYINTNDNEAFCEQWDDNRDIKTFYTYLILPYKNEIFNYHIYPSEPRLIAENVYILPKAECSSSQEYIEYDRGYYGLPEDDGYESWFEEYPINNFTLRKISLFGFNMVRLDMWPFLYDYKEKKLYFIDSFKLKLEIQDFDKGPDEHLDPLTRTLEEKPQTDILQAIRKIFYNSEDVDKIVERVNELFGGGSRMQESAISAPQNVYTIDGRLVLQNAAEEDCQKLSPGLYIAKGRKHLITK